MATPFHASEIGAVALAAMTEDNGLLSRVFRDAQTEFTQGVGVTVNVRAYSTEAHSTTPDNKTAPLQVSDVNSATHPVVLTDHLYVRNLLSAEDLLTLDSFARNITLPAVTAITDGANARIAALYNGLPAHSTLAWTGATDAYDVLIDARAALRSGGIAADVPVFVEASTEFYAALLKARVLDPSAPANLAGMDVHESSRIESGAFVIHTRKAVAAAPAPR